SLPKPVRLSPAATATQRPPALRRVAAAALQRQSRRQLAAAALRQSPLRQVAAVARRRSASPGPGAAGWTCGPALSASRLRPDFAQRRPAWAPSPEASARQRQEAAAPRDAALSRALRLRPAVSGRPARP